MENIYYLLIVALVFWYFVYLRRVSEFARQHAMKHCKAEGLQFIAIARRFSRIKFTKKQGFHWYSVFDLEFSGNGESQHVGVVSLRGFKLDNIELPIYRIH